MNLKYYLRGLGIGVIVTAVIMSITMGGRTVTLSNAEIRERAKALGMVEPAGVLTELESEGQSANAEPEKEGPDTALAKPAASPEAAVVVSPENSFSETPTPEAVLEEPSPEVSESPSSVPEASPSPSATALPTAVPSATPTINGGDTDASITIVVRSGESSYTICQKLENAGLVASASAFDSYLCSRGYDTKLRTGTFEIPSGAESEEIARILISG